MMVLSLSLLYLSAWEPIMRTYKQSKILPFSLSLECLNSVESAMIQPIPSQYFYQYLLHDIEDMEGVTLYALYADLRKFMVLCDRQEDSESLKELAV
jgi:hypothetical protein